MVSRSISIRIVLAALVAVALVALAGRARAAAPEYIWVAVDEDTWVLLSDWDGNSVLLLGNRVDDVPDPDRPRYELYLYWGHDWKTNSDKSSEVLARNVAVADQRGYLYPEYGDLPAVLLINGGSSTVVLSAVALSLLEDAGIPTIAETAGSSWLAWPQGSLVVGIILLIAAGAAYSGFRFRARTHVPPAATL